MNAMPVFSSTLTAHSASPLPWGEVGSRSDPGEGVRSIDSSRPPHPDPLPQKGVHARLRRAMGERESDRRCRESIQ
ncbi:penicillin-binding protein 1C [Rhodoplanes sp. Z2-YC6860]|nr:penicillin-binding protein 1C [Rhodoplanes sp. Z2-YC6860]